MTNPDLQVTSTSRLLRDDRYEDLGPKMRERLDRAEMDVARIRDYISVLAERDRQANGIARELCILLSVARPRDWYVIVSERERRHD